MKPVQEINSNPFILNLQNGLYNTLDDSFKAHTPEYFSTVQLKAAYAPDAGCPLFLRYLESMLAEEEIHLIQEIMGYLLLPVNKAQKSFVFVGAPNAGKSTLLNVVQEILLGSENVSNIPWQNLGDRFNRAELFGKLANIFADLPSKSIDDNGMFKALTGEDFTLTQVVDSIVPGQSYRLTVKAKKTSTYNAYVRAIINGDTEIDLFNTSEAFEWTEYTAVLPDVQDSVITIRIYSRDASLFVSDIMLTEGTSLHKWTPAPNEIYTSEVKIDRRGIEVSNADSAQRTVINNTEFSGYYNDEKIFSLNKDETLTKKTVVDGELTVGKTKFVPMATASQGLNIVILD